MFGSTYGRKLAPGETLAGHLEQNGVSRRDFLAFCGEMAVILGLGAAAAPRVAHALQSVKRPVVIWLELQECTGCVESILRANDPTIGNLLLDVISLDYSDLLSAGAGHAAEEAKKASMAANKGQYILIVTGSIPLKEHGVYNMIGGHTAHDVLLEAAAGAAAIVAVGACAHYGSVQAARPNPTGAVGVRDVIRNRPILNVAGCPPVPDVITATIIHYLTFGSMPRADAEGRPLFAYGARIHDQCPRRGHFDAGQFAHAFDDIGARQGWCLYPVGCKGPQTFSPCPITLWNMETSWPIGAGHPCIGCTEPYFWDTMTPFYQRLPNIGGGNKEMSVNKLGAALAGATAAGIAAHATWTAVSKARTRELPVLEQPPRHDPPREES